MPAVNQQKSCFWLILSSLKIKVNVNSLNFVMFKLLFNPSKTVYLQEDLVMKPVLAIIYTTVKEFVLHNHHVAPMLAYFLMLALLL